MKGSRSLTKVYHLLDKRNWDSFQTHGLLSTTLLSQLSGQDAVGRLAIQRIKSEQLACGAFIRDQSPMPPSALERCLRSGVTPREWYQLLNSKVFFWIDPQRLNRQRAACGAREQIVLVINAERMLTTHGAKAAVTPFNTGNAMRAAAARNFTSFVPYQSWVMEGWASEQIPGSKPRSMSHKPVELTLSDSVSDAQEYVTDIIHLREGEILS